MSICLLISGIDISGVRNIWNPGGKTFSSDGNVLGAINLAFFLKSKNLLGKPEIYNGTKDNVSNLLAGRTGIIFFQRYNENFGENVRASRSYSNAHIDLWNGSTINAPYKDQMLNSLTIWFWSIK